MVKEKTKTKNQPKKEAAVEKKTVKAKTKKESLSAQPRYIESIGRRKTAVARVRLFPQGEEKFLVNQKDYRQYFPSPALQQLAFDVLFKESLAEKAGVEIIVRGGGINAQAEAVRLGISRILVGLVPESDKRLRKLGYLTRDPRMRERKKFGLKRARKAPQWQKR
ncbi:MAG: 30S ribosomal protein S9 [Candidatus Nealsonbacteria bacterium]|nr:30S ribosomal protein S9 [Candidatus Nealsonbacteria bacterium]